jgi:hypothetical protein
MMIKHDPQFDTDKSLQTSIQRKMVFLLSMCAPLRLGDEGLQATGYLLS